LKSISIRNKLIRIETELIGNGKRPTNAVEKGFDAEGTFINQIDLFKPFADRE